MRLADQPPNQIVTNKTLRALRARVRAPITLSSILNRNRVGQVGHWLKCRGNDSPSSDRPRLVKVGQAGQRFRADVFRALPVGTSQAPCALERTSLADTSEPAAVWVPITDLRPWLGNPRKNSDAIKAVADSIRKFGFGTPLVARRQDRQIIAGHTRLLAARRLGLTHVPVRYLDLSAEDAQLLALADNKLGEIAEWDEGMLGRILGHRLRAWAPPAPVRRQHPGCHRPAGRRGRAGVALVDRRSVQRRVRGRRRHHHE